MNSPDDRVTVGVITTKVLSPPADGRADTLWNRIRLLQDDPRCRVVLLSLCRQPPAVTSWVTTVTVEWSLSFMGLLRGVLKGLPLQVSLYQNAERTERLAIETRSFHLNVVIADMVRTGLVALGVPASRHILDMDDRLSARYLGQARHGRSGTGLGRTPVWFPQFLTRLMAPFNRRILLIEAARLGRFEESICASFCEVVLVSETEARELADKTGRTIRAVPNFIEFSRPAPPGGPREPATLLYFGNLSAAHNVDTAVHLAKDILPRVRRRIPEARLQLVGRAVGPVVERLGRLEGISVHPDVPDIAPFLASATLCVCPMRFGSGIKTKILEALYFGLPVVTSPIGAEGIPEAASCLIVADGADATADAVVSALLGDRSLEPMVAAGRRIVDRHFSKDGARVLWCEAVIGSAPGH